MVYPVEVGMGLACLVTGYSLAMNGPFGATLGRRVKQAATVDSNRVRVGRGIVAVERAAGALLCLVGVVLLLDGFAV